MKIALITAKYTETYSVNPAIQIIVRIITNESIKHNGLDNFKYGIAAVDVKSAVAMLQDYLRVEEHTPVFDIPVILNSEGCPVGVDRYDIDKSLIQKIKEEFYIK